MRWITAQIKWIMILAGAPRAGVAVVVDTVVICLFAIYLMSARKEARSA